MREKLINERAKELATQMICQDQKDIAWRDLMPNAKKLYIKRATAEVDWFLCHLASKSPELTILNELADLDCPDQELKDISHNIAINISAIYAAKMDLAVEAAKKEILDKVATTLIDGFYEGAEATADAFIEAGKEIGRQEAEQEILSIICDIISTPQETFKFLHPEVKYQSLVGLYHYLKSKFNL